MQTHPSASRPFLRWPGGNTRLLRFIWPNLPTAGRLIEPFIGAGAVTLSAPDSFNAFIVSDANEALVEIWQAVKERPDELIRQARTYFTEEFRSRDAYAQLRSTFNATTAPLERAALFLYLNKFGFNGLPRFNRAGQFNTPYGNPAVVPRLPEQQIYAASKRLRRAEIHVGDFSRVMQTAGEGDVVYCDPPYLPDGQATFTAYTADGFSIEDQRRLISEARQASARGAFVAISNHDTATARSLYEEFDIIELTAYRSISAQPTKRGRARELLAILGPR